jgi:hypothetical protein
MAPGFTCLPYYPNYDRWAAKLSSKGSIDEALPHGFPCQLNSTLVWDGQNLPLGEHTSSDGTECVLQLTNSQLEEIDAALRHFQGKHSL